MAHKSKTQRAKAAAAKANRKDREQRDAIAAMARADSAEATEAAKQGEQAAKAAAAEEASKKFFKSKPKAEEKAIKKEEKKPAKKRRFQFLYDVKAELKRVTWPSRQDVIRWSGVVVAALVFFGVYVAVLDNVIITPLLVFISGLGA
jgi:preprotein translocase subunit SecE